MRKRIIFLSAVFISALALIIFFYSFFVIYRDVKTNYLRAQGVYGGDCLDSLVKFVQSEDTTFRQKNSAIWALGQLADKKALPFLYELDKSLPEQDRCRYDEYLCKYEIQKAIKWCGKGNITSWMYQNRENWR